MTNAYATARVRTRHLREGCEGAKRGSIRSRGESVHFPLGKLYATPGVLALFADIRDAGKPYTVQRLAQADPMVLALAYVARHASGDWGDVDAEDWTANDEALRIGARVFSAYQLDTGARLWIITEADRSATTVLLPEEY